MNETDKNKTKKKTIQCSEVIKIMLAHKCKASKQGQAWAVNQLFTSFIWHVTKMSTQCSNFINSCIIIQIFMYRNKIYNIACTIHGL